MPYNPVVQQQVLAVQQLAAQMVVLATAAEAMYTLSALAMIPLASTFLEPTKKEVAKEFMAACKDHGVELSIDEYLPMVACIAFRTGITVIIVNPEIFNDNYVQIYGEDWRYWKRYARRIVLHEIEHPKLDKRLRELECWGVPVTHEEQTAQGLLHDYYVEHVVLKDYPIPMAEAVRKKNWAVLREALFDPLLEYVIPVVLMAAPEDIRREFSDTPLPRMKDLCESIKTPEDICRVYPEMVRLVKAGTRGL